MDIKIITCHDVYNYGASLQSYALQTYLETLGFQVQIIDYTPNYQKVYDIWFRARNKKGFWGNLSNYSNVVFLFVAFYEYIKLFPTFKRVKAFISFKKIYLKTTKEYKTYKELVEDPPIADVYIAGSDQIWSTYFENGKDPSYYCCFGDKNTKRISYAASFGFPFIYGGYNVLVKSLLSGFNAISIREIHGKKILLELGYKAEFVLDPIFLLTPTLWKKTFKKERSINFMKYVLVYDLSHIDERMSITCKKLSTLEGIPILAINDKYETKYADININDGGPIDFIYLIMNAEHIVTDSFHAMAFSVLFHKDFYSYYKWGNISRIEDFLYLIGLSNRLNSNDLQSPIDWVIVQKILDKYISTSKQYLRYNLFQGDCSV